MTALLHVNPVLIHIQHGQWQHKLPCGALLLTCMDGTRGERILWFIQSFSKFSGSSLPVLCLCCCYSEDNFAIFNSVRCNCMATEAFLCMNLALCLCHGLRRTLCFPRIFTPRDTGEAPILQSLSVGLPVRTM